MGEGCCEFTRAQESIMKCANNRGSVLIIAYTILYVLMTLAAGFALYTLSELNFSRRYRDATMAFWLAEAGLTRFIQNPHMLDAAGSEIMSENEGKIYLMKDDSNVRRRLVTSTGEVRGVKRSLQIEFPGQSPRVFENTLSSNNDFLITGNKSSLIVNGRLRLSGTVINKAKHSNIIFEDKREKINSQFVSLVYPDANGNGVTDEFEDFVAFNRSLISRYPASEVVYIQGNDTYTMVPDKSLKGKKLIFVEGNKQGRGDVVIQLSAGWEKNQNLTVISTGKVTFNQAGISNATSQLNIIAWSGYEETAILPSSHYGMIYTHGAAVFDNILDTSVTNGCIVANGGIRIKEVWSTKTFNYRDVRDNGVVPPGFEGLWGDDTAGYLSKPVSWREI